MNCYSPTCSVDQSELRAFYNQQVEEIRNECFREFVIGGIAHYGEDYTFFKVIIGDFNAKIGPRRTSEERHIETHGLEWNEQDTVVDNIDEEYDRLIQHLHVSAMKAESSKVTKRRLSPKTIELIRQHGIARAADNRELTSEHAKQCRQAIKEDLKERKEAVMVEAAEAGKSIRKAHRCFAVYKTKMSAPMEKIIQECYSDLFDSYVHDILYHRFSLAKSDMPFREKSNSTGPNKIRSQHLKNLPPVLMNTLARLFTRYLSEYKVPTQWKTSNTILFFKKGDLHDVGNYRPIWLLEHGEQHEGKIRRTKAVCWSAKAASNQLADPKLCNNLFHSTPFPALLYAEETSTTSKTLRGTHKALDGLI
uniref:Reverse transcriptase domain-containing protein n=1 Tax=Angiostrongylus cantonensis TaxID=6313 RepID=A0A0K0DKD4_ANGCA